MADDLTGAIEQIGADIKDLRNASPYNGGWRDVRSLLNEATVTGASAARVRRKEDRIDFEFHDLALTGSGDIFLWGTLPPGYRPTRTQYRNLGTSVGAMCDVAANTGGGLRTNGVPSSGATYRGGFSIWTEAAPPTAHPGTATP